MKIHLGIAGYSICYLKHSSILLFLLTHRARVFETKVNKETVDLDPVVLDEDIKLLNGLLQEFKYKTGSEVAGRMLDDWPASASKFVKVCGWGCSLVSL